MKQAPENRSRGNSVGPNQEVQKNGWILHLALLVFLIPRASAQANEGPESYTEVVVVEGGEELSFEMLVLPGGTFTMGSTENEPGHRNDESPRRTVRLSPFYLSSTEVTLGLFTAFYRETLTEKRNLPGAHLEGEEADALTGPTPIYGDLTMGKELDYPAIGMSWHNAVTFCKWLSGKTGKRYRLPTEAEWEYACRAGTSNLYGTVGEEAQLEAVAWFDKNSDGTTQSVGAKKPNEWGLFDMSGNVREWVQDFYSPVAYAELGAATVIENPKGPTSGRVHVARGGDYSSFPEELRCAARAFELPHWRELDPQIPKSRWWLPFMDIIGFRVARSVE